MTMTLLVVAMIAAANPFRALSARPADGGLRAVVAAGGTVMVLVLLSALMSGPFLDLVDVSGPSARIAAGVALLVVALKDAFTAPPRPEPSLAGWRAGVVPLAFPVLFSPALALLAVAGASERGVGPSLSASAVALAPALVLLLTTPRVPERAMTATVGGFATAIAALVVLDGVYAI